MLTTTSVASQFFRGLRNREGLGGLPGVLHAGCELFGAVRAADRDVRTLQAYADWMQGLLTSMPNGRYAVKSFATDADRNSVWAYGVFSATHTGCCAPRPPTGKSTTSARVQRDGVRGRQDSAHDENLERRVGDEGTWLGLDKRGLGAAPARCPVQHGPCAGVSWCRRLEVQVDRLRAAWVRPGGAGGDPNARELIVTLQSSHDFTTTLQRLLAALAAKGIAVFVPVSIMRAGAASVGLDRRPRRWSCSAIPSRERRRCRRCRPRASICR